MLNSPNKSAKAPFASDPPETLKKMSVEWGRGYFTDVQMFIKIDSFDVLLMKLIQIYG